MANITDNTIRLSIANINVTKIQFKTYERSQKVLLNDMLSDKISNMV